MYPKLGHSVLQIDRISMYFHIAPFNPEGGDPVTKDWR